jgi:hypothetical protein
MSAEESHAPSVYCGGCGNTIGESAKFCPSCGTDQAQFLGAAPESPKALSPAAPALQATAEAPRQEAQSSASAHGTAPLARAHPATSGRGSVLTSPWRTPEGHRRSVAWIYYALIAVGALIASFQHPAFLLAAIVACLYSTYLFRGGRFVLWFW